MTLRWPGWFPRRASPRFSSRSTVHVAFEASQAHSSASERIVRPPPIPGLYFSALRIDEEGRAIPFTNHLTVFFALEGWAKRRR
jgi:hypothetical protein